MHRRTIQANGFSRVSIRFSTFRSGLIFSLLILLLSVHPAVAQRAPSGDKFTKGDAYILALLVSSPKAAQSTRVEAIKYGARQRVDEINKSGGIKGRPVRLLILDDRKDPEKTVKNVELALSHKRLLAIVGLNSSTRGAKVIELIGKSGVPFISDISLDRLFVSHKNIFSMTSSISGDTGVFTRFLKENYRRPMFVGRKDELFAKEFHAALMQQKMGEVAAVHWMSRDKDKFSAEMDLVIRDIKQKQPDILSVAVFSYQGGELVKRLAAAGIKIPIYFVTGSVYSIVQKTRGSGYQGSLFGIGRGIPNVEGERLAHLGKQAAYKEMRSRFPAYLGNSLIYGDLLDLMTQAVRRPPKPVVAGKEPVGLEDEISAMRLTIVEALQGYRQGRKVFRGIWRNWSFTKARSAALNSFVLWAPDGGPELKLWPVQYVRTLAGLKKAPVAFINVDLIRIHQIDANKQRFDAEFYLSLSSAHDSAHAIELKSMEFNNVIRGEGGSPFLNIREIHNSANRSPASTSIVQTSAPLVNKQMPENANDNRGGEASETNQSKPDKEARKIRASEWINRLYIVKGRFRFTPALSQYPFDSQRFSISIQPAKTTAPFLVQPRPSRSNSVNPRIIGWRIYEGKLGEYIGYEEENVTLIGKYGSEQKIMPYYRFNFSWVAKRLTKDYFVRVVIPLGLILMVAYFSIFLPAKQIDSVVAMQITALLSTVALYFSIPKLQTETATLSDQVFVFSEMIIVVMIFFSIIRVNAIVRQARIFERALFVLDIVLFPVLAFLMFRYVIAVSEGTIKPVTEETLTNTLYSLLPQLF